MKLLTLIMRTALAVTLAFSLTCTDKSKTIYGTWKLNAKESTDIVTVRNRQLQMKILKSGESVSITHLWLSRNRVDAADSVRFVPGGSAVEIPVNSPMWSANWFMGVSQKPGSSIAFTGSWKELDRELKLVKEEEVMTSQGDNTITTTQLFRLNRKGDKLVVIEKRSSRPTPIELVFDRVISEQ